MSGSGVHSAALIVRLRPPHEKRQRGELPRGRAPETPPLVRTAKAPGLRSRTRLVTAFLFVRRPHWGVRLSYEAGMK